MKTILFVCTGNTCRSPMAEEIFRLRMGEDSDWDSASAGLFAGMGSPASTNSVNVLEEINLNLRSHQSQPLTAELIKAANLIVTMTAQHRHHILESFPEVENRVCLLKSFGTSKVPADISDPFGGSLEIYRKTRDEIDRALSDLILFIRTEN